ncbi:MAG: molybdate ABC transporter substrate-binding protein, partial [Betaproteobacteria bacterium]|nr:molybdate ABC transporter substrate-binding protein [Betaproteobacteria bacterium]
MRLSTLLLALLRPLTANAAEVTVFAAASLKESLDAVARTFEMTTGHKVVVSYGASSALAKQIESGAPADLFVSADLDWADYVEQRKLLAPGTRTHLLRNELVLIAPAGSTLSVTLAPGLDLGTLLSKERLAIANPDA